MERRRAIRSEASLAALRARVRGMMSRDWANSPMASCSREPCCGGLVFVGWDGGGRVSNEGDGVEGGCVERKEWGEW